MESMLKLNETISPSCSLGSFLVDPEMNPTSFSSLLRGPEYLLCLFSSFSFEKRGEENTMEHLIVQVNRRLAFFTSRDIRVVIINREIPLTNKVWAERRSLEIEVYADPQLKIVGEIVGIRDITETNLHLKEGVDFHQPHALPKPGAFVFDKLGTLKSKLTIPDLNNITATCRDVERICGISG